MSGKSNSSLHLYSPDAALVRGRDAYASGRHKKAIEYFTSIINSCDCNRRDRPRMCRCKDFERVAQAGTSIFHEAMYNCRCNVSLKWDKCHDPYHIRALDYRAAVFEKEDLHLAKRDAEWLLQTAPRALEGYLRLGKIYRMEKKPKVALAIWNAGIEVGRKEGLGGSRKIKQLYEVRQPLRMHYVRVDPMTLPVELVEHIFSYFQLTDLCRVQGVCKRWDYFFDSRPCIWKHIEFPAGLKRAPPSSWTKTLANRMRGAAKSLVIPSPVQERLRETQWLQLADAAKQARRLELDFRHGPMPKLPSNRQFPSRLSSLKIIFSESRGPRYFDLFLDQEENDFLRGILERCNYNLESLWLGHARVPWLFQDLPPALPRLRYLRISRKQDASLISLPSLAAATPRLEQLYLDGPCSIECTLDETPSCPGAWSDLRVVIAECEVSSWFDLGWASNSPMNPEKIRVLESRSGMLGFRDGLGMTVGALSSVGQFLRKSMDSLERYWLEAATPDFLSQERLQDPLVTGKLYELGLAFPDTDRDDTMWGEDPLPAQAFLQRLPWLYGGPGVRMLGLFDFNLDSGLTIPDSLQPPGEDRPKVEKDQAAVLVAFIESFPRLETLVLGSKFCEAREVAALTEAVVNRGKIKKIYLRGVTGQLFLDIRELAAMKGAEVMVWQRKIPWPYPLKPHPDGL
ncbi:hypothetical protein SODALDRAFT_330833 [Sodiomyces alkalinus F11]|uniref:F-box domain-containing protein n=1 Tax=Sodiomyces alkalinus (strain CBS 110278 / VKM F-3762 / F11) TaxID=1314773 RepID=A0A3N2Q3C7_SODAK|nr:hypothetical protein SODALDRAFT_330833 [Sodiomyces alkalinus F11]ROT41125.1 hypothetical protein SODALDRAFT_330833 [Sodiomyces alkalinus F11]